MGNYKTEQEGFWQGEFGDDYVLRNQGAELLARKTAYFASVFTNMIVPESALEFGSNIGLNERALLRLFPHIKMETVEINESAAAICEQVPNTIVHRGSFLDFETDGIFDLTMCNGVLIHTNPDYLEVVYDKLYKYSKKYILISEYYNPTPVEVEYRGYQGKLYKRDFAGELMDKYTDLDLINYGFRYHRDKSFWADDSNWFLLEKR